MHLGFAVAYRVKVVLRRNLFPRDNNACKGSIVLKAMYTHAQHSSWAVVSIFPGTAKGSINVCL
jgi:hypothetical protein